MRKKINGYEKYEIDVDGNVWSWKNLTTGKVRKLKTGKCSNGYHHVILYKNNERKNISIHRLVASAFIPNPEKKSTVNHINGIKTDNRIENLEWATQLENIRHAIKTGLRNTKGIKHRDAKLTPEIVREIRSIYAARTSRYWGARSLAKKYNVSHNVISDVALRQTWTHIQESHQI